MKINNVKLLKEGLYEISRGFESIARAIGEEELKGQVEIEEIPTIEEPKEVEVKNEVEPISLEKEALDKMTYRDLQKLAKDLDVLVTGKKEELVARLSGEEVVEEELSEEVEEIVEEIVEIQEETEEVEEIEEDKVLTKADQIENALVDYSEEDLADVLDSIGVSPKGKRQALLAKVVKAVEEGKLEIELEPETETEEVEEAVEPEVEIVEEEEMTEARRQRVMEVKEEVKDMIKNDEMSEEQINAILAYVYSSDGFSPSLPLNERIDMVEEMYVNLVDDEGQSQELEVPYERGGEYACCSHTLREKENGNLHCKVCNQEYMIG